MSVFATKKPFSAVTVTVENLTSEAYEEEDLSGIPDLVEVITLQATGPSEAARAIRKKLKYGNVHRQIRALVLLDGLIQNAGERFQRTFVDEPLLERLRVCGTSNLSDIAVRNKCRELFRSWSQYAGRPGLDSLARLHKELPKRKQAVTQERSRVLRETEENPFVDDEQEAAAKAAREAQKTPGPASAAPASGSTFGHTSTKSSSGTSSFFGSSKDKKKEKEKEKNKGKRKPFNLEAEKEQMKSVIADSSIAATNLMNALQSINREVERISENQAAVERFEACKLLRRKVLRYVHNVEEEQWLGGLLHANDELVHALMSFEQFDRSIDADSDSDDELAEQAHLYRMATIKGKEAMAKASGQSPTSSQPPDLSELNISHSPAHSAPPRPPPMLKPHSNPPPQPPRPAVVSSVPAEEEDDDDPFGDSHALDTPQHERDQPRW
ncbi:related to LSB5 - possible role in the regulation of actin cytoskeletal organization [Fusarium torulosum]|uniref:Related to LSB5 - possible role in the regulation of actin cytoskeletal organization n=1 Tax=Fusarium torulosum TaxID=33205 RepID=A0AAE8SED2_9HYPO|nr:related to LSB5 - possible role in the regulation of actin cytoskeletal organization [Fusarium torulosum]